MTQGASKERLIVSVQQVADFQGLVDTTELLLRNMPQILGMHGRRFAWMCCMMAGTSSPRRSMMSSSSFAHGLNLAVVTGSTRTEGPPRPILGPRVSTFVCNQLKDRGHKVTVVNPVDLDLPLLQKPHFAYAEMQMPPELARLHEIFQQADGYVCITPEYNHAPSPALLNVLNHFGSSTFSFKPSAIVSYSAGQWGGTRAAIALRPVLSELGCLPVSAMIHFPKAYEFLDEDGTVKTKEDQDPLFPSAKDQWTSYCDRTFSQLEWWGEAAKNHRAVANPFAASPAFKVSPKQRNAPGP